MTVMPSKIAVPFMHIVLPMGSTNPAIRCGTPSCSCAMSSAVGSVALLELVENAVTSAARMREKNITGERPIRNRTMPEIVMSTCASSAPSTVSTNAAIATSKSNPNRDDEVQRFQEVDHRLRAIRRDDRERSAEHQAEEDHAQHVGIGGRLDGITRDDVHQRIDAELRHGGGFDAA